MAEDVGWYVLEWGVGVEGDFLLTGNNVLFDVVENVHRVRGREGDMSRGGWWGWGETFHSQGIMSCLKLWRTFLVAGNVG